MLDDERMLAALDTDVSRLEAVDPSTLDAPVGACPGWTALDVLAHLGVIHRRVVAMLVDGEAYRPLVDQPPPPPPDEVVEWQRSQSRAAVHALRSSDLDAPSTTWLGEATVRTWLRRMVHETAIHRWDVEDAIGTATTIDADVAVDGIDELLDLFVPQLDADTWARVAPAGATVHVHAVDAPGEWLLQLGPDGLVATRAHAKGDVAVRGPASDLALRLWSRRPGDELIVFGDRDLLDRVLDAMCF
jgi:uncharacterized protein (TIGR03083 family)